jgi:hypothetical protein
MPAPDLLTAAEAAALLRVDVRRIQALARAGRLPGVRAERLGLAAGQEVLGVIKSTEIMVARAAVRAPDPASATEIA